MQNTELNPDDPEFELCEAGKKRKFELIHRCGKGGSNDWEQPDNIHICPEKMDREIEVRDKKTPICVTLAKTRGAAAKPMNKGLSTGP